jgi:hypothetical protein
VLAEIGQQKEVVSFSNIVKLYDCKQWLLNISISFAYKLPKPKNPSFHNQI